MNVKPRQLKDGRTVYDLTWQTGRKDPATGRPAREFETHPGPKREAERRWVRRQAEIDKAGAAYVAPATEPLGEYLDKWLSKIRPDIEDTTYEGYESACRVHLKPALGDVPLNALTPEHVTDMLDGLRSKPGPSGKPLSAKTISNIRVILRTALTPIVPRRISFNPVDLVKPPKRKGRSNKALSPDQVALLLDAATNRRIRWLLEFLWLGYMRRSEALGLKWTDLDPESGMLTVCRQVRKRGGAHLVEYLKTDAGYRIIALPAQALEVLQHQRELLAFERRKMGARYRDLGLIFPTNKGTLAYPDNVSQDFREICAQAGLAVTRLHVLRHSGITMELLAGAKLEDVSKRAGHADIATTANIYHDLLPEANREAANKTEEYLRRRRRRQP